MAEHRGPLVEHRAPEGFTSPLPEKGPSGSQVVAVLTLFPIGGILLAFSGITLAGTVIGLAVATPLFVIFSPVLIPAAILIVLAVTGFLTSGAFGVTALTSLTWVVKYLRAARKKVPEQMEMAKRRAVEAAERAKEAGQQMQSRAQEGART